MRAPPAAVGDGAAGPEHGSRAQRAATDAERTAALRSLADQEGHASVDDLLEAVGYDAVVPAICTGCNYRDDWEPDAQGECPECGAEMASALVLAGLI